MLTAIGNPMQSLLATRHVTLGFARHVDNVTAVATTFISTIGTVCNSSCSKPIAQPHHCRHAHVISAHGAAPNLHPFRGCTIIYNNNRGRHCKLSSTIVVGSGRLTTLTTHNVSLTNTVHRIHRRINRAARVRIRISHLSRVPTILTNKTSAVVLSGFSLSSVHHNIRLVSNGTVIRTDNGVDLRQIPTITTANISIVSINTLARSMHDVSLKLS